MSICQFCLKQFTNKYNLSVHLKKTQKCIQLQKLFQTEERLTNEIQTLKNEIEVLKELSNEKLLALQNEIESLKNENEVQKESNAKLQIENTLLQKDHNIVLKLAQEPKITKNTTNITNNLTIYDPNIIKDRFKTAIEVVEVSDLYDGQKSISRLVAPCLQNDDGTKMLQCSDYARNIFITKNPEGNIVKDIHCRNLCNLIEPIASQKANQLFHDDFVERSKYHEIKQLEKSIKKKEKQIESMIETSKGFKNTSDQYKSIMNRIDIKEKENERDLKKYHELKNSGVKHQDDNDFVDIKLSTAIDNIRELKTNSTVFSKTLSQYI